MSAGALDDREEPPSTLARLRRENREFDEYLKWAWTLKPIRTFFIPFAAGISEDGKTVYVSYDINAEIGGINCEECLVRHETTEWALRYYLGIGEDYDNDPLGHRISNNAEFDRVRVIIDRPNALEVYKEIIDEQVYRSERQEIKDRPIPRDLALYPYEDDPVFIDQLSEAMYNERSEEEWFKLHPDEPKPTRPTIEPEKDTRLTRDCFIYLDPKAPEDEFAQCSTCQLWMSEGLCAIHGPDVKVTGEMSCALYIHGGPDNHAIIEKVVTPEESGLVNREVRCENCTWFYNNEKCNLFTLLNRIQPDVFNLDTKVHAKGCCNAQQAN